MLLFNKRFSGITVRWGKIKAPPVVLGGLHIPIGFFNYAITSVGNEGAPLPPATVDIPVGQPIGLTNYGVTYANNVK